MSEASSLTLEPVTAVELELDFDGAALRLESEAGSLQFELIPIVGGGDKHYRHVQGSASDTWVISHALGKRPAITVTDSAGTEVIGDVQHINDNLTIISFAGIFSGEAVCN